MPTAVVDACCTINLYAAGDLPNLLPALGLEWYVPAAVTREALFIRKPDPENADQLIPEPIDFQPALGAGVLRTCDVEGEAETNLFVQLAASLDDGEAACLAIAKCRGWAVATDDRKARRTAGQLNV